MAKRWQRVWHRVGRFWIPARPIACPRRGRGMDAGNPQAGVHRRRRSAARLLVMVGGWSAMHRPSQRRRAGGAGRQQPTAGQAGQSRRLAGRRRGQRGSSPAAVDTDVGKLAPPPETPAPHRARAADRPGNRRPVQPCRRAGEARGQPVAIASAAAAAAGGRRQRPAPAAPAAKPAARLQRPPPPSADHAGKTGRARRCNSPPSPPRTPPRPNGSGWQAHARPVRQPPPGRQQDRARRPTLVAPAHRRLRRRHPGDQFCEQVRAKGGSCSVADF